MTIASQTTAETMLGDGVNRKFPFTFRAWAGEVRVVVTAPDDTTEDVTGLASIVHNSAEEGLGGIVTYPAALEGTPVPAGWKLTVLRDMDFLQPVRLVNAARYDPVVIEQELDRLTAMIQQVREVTNRSAQLSIGTAYTAAEFLDIIYEARAQCMEAMEEVAAVVGRVEGELDAKAAEAIAAMETELQECMEAMEEVAAVVGRVEGELDAKAAEAIAAMETELQECMEAMEEVAAVVGRVEGELDAKAAEAIAAMETELQECMEAMEEVAAVVGRVEGELDAKAAEAIAAMQTALEDCLTQVQGIIAEVDGKVAEAIAALETSLEEVAAVVGRVEGELDAKAAEAIAAMQTALEDCLTQVQGIIAEVDGKVAEAIAALETSLEEVAAVVGRVEGELDAKAAEAIAAMETELQECLDIIYEARAQCMEAMEEVAAVVGRVEGELDAKAAEAIAAMQTALEDCLTQVQGIIAEVDGKVAEAIAALETSLANCLTQLSDFAGRAETAASGAEDAEALAKKWATNPEDEPVTTDPAKFSAYHWAQKAQSATAVNDASETVKGIAFAATAAEVEAGETDPSRGGVPAFVTPETIKNIPSGLPDINTAAEGDILTAVPGGGGGLAPVWKAPTGGGGGGEGSGYIDYAISVPDATGRVVVNLNELGHLAELGLFNPIINLLTAEPYYMNIVGRSDIEFIVQIYKPGGIPGVDIVLHIELGTFELGDGTELGMSGTGANVTLLVSLPI